MSATLYWLCGNELEFRVMLPVTFFSKLLRRDTRETWEKKGSKTALDLATERVRQILSKHEPRQLDPAMEKELLDYLNAVRERSMADFEAAEWDD